MCNFLHNVVHCCSFLMVCHVLNIELFLEDLTSYCTSMALHELLHVLIPFMIEVTNGHGIIQ